MNGNARLDSRLAWGRVAWLLMAAAVGWSPARSVVGDEATVVAQLDASLARYKTPVEWAARRVELREEFLKGARLWPLPARPAVQAIRHSRREYDGYAVENVALEALPGFYAVGNLYTPLAAASPGPAILCPHGHFRPLGRMREEHQVRCAHFARMGATVFSYSMVGWQESKQTTHDDPLVLTLQTWSSLRAVDFVSDLPGVDPRRVAVTGASGGGTQTFFLALIDDRIQASAPMVIVYPWAAPEGCMCEGGMPVMQAAHTNAIELAAATSPRPQLLISVGLIAANSPRPDPTANFPKVGFPFIQKMYEISGAADRVRNVHLPDEGHDFGPTKRREVYAFFARHLHMNALPEDTTKIAIETPEQMEVFNERHPRPAHAVEGSEAVAAAFETHLATLRAAASSGPPAPPRLEYTFKESGPADEALIFTPPGFDQVGQPATVPEGAESGELDIAIRDHRGQSVVCRVNVVGSDGNFYEPAGGPLKQHSLTGLWPQWPNAWGNRPGKAPVRYFGRYFYTRGDAVVRVPPGTTRIEVWRGFEHSPRSLSVHVAPGQRRSLTVTVSRSVDMPAIGYWSGDPHIHIPRRDDGDEERIFDLMEAEDIHYATLLAYNEPAGPYSGFMEKLDSPQFRGLGKRSLQQRGDYSIVSGQEYRSGTYGHMNLFLLDQLVLPGQDLDANNWPLYGHVARDVREAGGYAFYAHGGYAQEIYADAVHGNIDGVELLQFGVYRGIGLSDWYRFLNCGFRFPATAASDYPACRKLGDCQTYVYSAERPSFDAWLRGAAEGRSFITTGPLVLLELDGQQPGARIEKQGVGPHTVTARVRVRCDVTPVTDVQLIVNGRVVEHIRVPASEGRGNWIDLEQSLALDKSSWIAARAFSLSANETPDAESHTNPVYVYLNGKAPFDRKSVDGLLAAIDGQIAAHKKRKFPEQAKVIAYFEQARDILARLREAGGAPSKGHPSDLASDLPTLDNPGARVHTEEELRAFLKPLPPKPIEEVLASFEAVDGFQMQLVAREPLVRDPIAAAFDENGRLYVCEMRDYPFKPKSGQEPIGSVRLLEDTDGDGTFDKSHLFADQLLWAGGVAPWRGGVFVAAPPDIWYMKDTDGDCQADIRQKVYTGFGLQNQQAMLNNLQWGLDHKIYGSTAGNGGVIRPADKPDAEGVSVNGRDFRFDPVTGEFEAITGTIQFGNSFDDWGNRFLCSESSPLLHAVLPQHYLARNPFLPVPQVIQTIAGGPVPIFRTSPLERWRIVRSSRRIAANARPATVAGASHHVIDAAAGTTVYRGGAYPAKYYGSVFVGDAQNNLIHRRVLVPDGVTFQSERGEENTEFVRSSDNWFRPVNFINAPDGTLYVLDMSREILESIHVPNDVAKFLDFASGRDHGRIYRLAPPGYGYPGPPALGASTTDELVAALESPHGWWRDTAHRLLRERQDPKAVPLLRATLAGSRLPQARLHALWSLAGLKAVRDDDLLQALGDEHPALREHAMQLAEPRLDANQRVLERVVELAGDENPRIRLQATFSLGECRQDAAAKALARLARGAGGDPWLRTAVLSSVTRQADRLIAELVVDPSFVDDSNGLAFVGQLTQVVAARGRTKELEQVLQAVDEAARATRNRGLATYLIRSAGSTLARIGKHLVSTESRHPGVKRLLADELDRARGVATDARAEVAARQQAISLLGCFAFAEVGETLTGLIDVQQPDAVQIAAMSALASYPEPRVAETLIGGWREYGPAVRKEAIDVLLARREGTRALLEAAIDGQLSVAQLDDNRRALLLKHEDNAIRKLSEQLFGKDRPSPRRDVIADYKKALALERQPARGEQIFRRECSACHRLGEIGNAIGPDLASSASREGETLLQHVLDPNQYVLPTYEQYVVQDDNGRTYTGMMASQTATSITLKREENKTDTILRTNIVEIFSTGKSLMPEGFEKKINLQEMADLIAFLQSFRPSGMTEAPLDIGTLPGLVEP